MCISQSLVTVVYGSWSTHAPLVPREEHFAVGAVAELLHDAVAPRREHRVLQRRREPEVLEDAAQLQPHVISTARASVTR